MNVRIPLVSLIAYFSFSILYAQKVIVSPYLQPGNAPGLSMEEKVLIWQTDSLPGEFEVIYVEDTSFNSDKKAKAAKVTSVSLDVTGNQTRIYRARMKRLKFDQYYSYQVNLNGEAVSAGVFKTRTKGNQLRFAVLADCGEGSREQGAIAKLIYDRQPDFALLVGDVVYEYGTMSEYLKNYFPYYNTGQMDSSKGAPLMRSIPFYAAIGNHDVLSSDLEKYPDGLAYFYYHDLPMNAPSADYQLIPKGDDEAIKRFKKSNEGRFPSMTNYSFVNGNVQFIVLDSNPYTVPLDPALVPWIKEELSSSKATWKVVAFHHPVFNSSDAHYDDQLMRLLAPVLQNGGVDLVLNGHVHNYQRTLPLLFEPERNSEGTQYVISPKGRVDGDFTIDFDYDGISNTRTDGIIYIVTGAGGAPLYDYKKTDHPEKWLNGPESEDPFTVKMVSNIHSFTFIEIDDTTLILKQIDKEGNVFDEITVTK